MRLAIRWACRSIVERSAPASGIGPSLGAATPATWHLRGRGAARWILHGGADATLAADRELGGVKPGHAVHATAWRA